MLAYVFWHRPREGVDVAAYEEALRSFHSALDSSSASFRLAALPFSASEGFEDWYLAESWNELGKLNLRAVDDRRRAAHDRAAFEVSDGWGSIYELVCGDAEIPAGTSWFDKPRGTRSEEFIESLGGKAIWRRQMVLGPAPEFCVAVSAEAGRNRI